MNNEVSCWNKCENELACNSVSFYNNSELPLYFGSNCFLYTNKAPKKLTSKYFITKIHKKESKYNNLGDDHFSHA